MKLVVDIGNTNSKIAVFSSKNLQLNLSVVATETIDKHYINNFLTKHNINYIIVSSVINAEKTSEIFNDINKTEIFILLSYNTKINFINKYSTKNCGSDRIATVAGAWNKFPNESSLIITGGTCITFDFIDNLGIYYGGAISLGLQMRFLALSQFTEALPLVTMDWDYNKLIGTNTKECILSGVQIGLKAELLGAINNYFLKFPKIDNVILNGGDANFFYNLIKKSEIFSYIHKLPNLTLEGLNAILNLNLNND